MPQIDLTFWAVGVLMLSYWYWSPNEDAKVDRVLFPSQYGECVDVVLGDSHSWVSIEF